MIVDLTAWGHVRVGGGDRVRFLHGLTTINVETMTEGDQRWGCVLNAKGRVLSVIQLEHADDHFVIHCEGDIADKTLGIFERYAVMDDVELAHLPAGPAYRVWTTPAEAWAASCKRAALPGPAAPAGEVEAFRIAAGFVRYGADVDEDSFPFETPLGQFLDYDKGCYVGQEPVFRVRSQGNAARALRGLRLADGAEVAPGANVAHASRPNAGTVTSVGRSAEFGHVALAYLHRTVFEVGGTVVVGDQPAIVTSLPMT
jgi:tRNA-modifying protein YgfZ